MQFQARQLLQSLLLTKSVRSPRCQATLPTKPTDINEDGLVIGVSSTDSSSVPQLADSVTWLNGLPTALPQPFGTFGRSVNNLGHSTGNTPVGGAQHAFFWDDSNLTDIHAIGDDSFGFGINDADEIAGWFQTPQVPRTAFRWKNGITTDLGTLGGPESSAFNINHLGQVVGSAETPNGNDRAFIWGDSNNNNVSDPGEMVQLPDMGLSSAANGVNDSGHAVGFVLDNQFNRQGAIWTDTSGFTLTGVLPGNVESEAFDINNFGQVVGHSQAVPFIWDNGQIANLNSLIPQGLGWTLFRAVSINDNGWIVGEGRRFGVETGFLLKPIPEPTTLTLIACALLVLVGRRRKPYGAATAQPRR